MLFDYLNYVKMGSEIKGTSQEFNYFNFQQIFLNLIISVIIRIKLIKLGTFAGAIYTIKTIRNISFHARFFRIT